MLKIYGKQINIVSALKTATMVFIGFSVITSSLFLNSMSNKIKTNSKAAMTVNVDKIYSASPTTGPSTISSVPTVTPDVTAGAPTGSPIPTTIPSLTITIEPTTTIVPSEPPQTLTSSPPEPTKQSNDPCTGMRGGELRLCRNEIKAEITTAFPSPNQTTPVPVVIQPTTAVPSIPTPKSSAIISTLAIDIAPTPIIQSSITTNQTVAADTSKIQSNMDLLQAWCSANPDECKAKQQQNDKESLLAAVSAPLVGVVVVAGVPTAITAAAYTASAALAYGFVGQMGTGIYYSATGQTYQTAPGLISSVDNSSKVIGDTGVIIASGVTVANAEEVRLSNLESEMTARINRGLTTLNRVAASTNAIQATASCLGGKCDPGLAAHDVALHADSISVSLATGTLFNTAISNLTQNSPTINISGITVTNPSITVSNTTNLLTQSQTEINGIQKTTSADGAVVNQPESLSNTQKATFTTSMLTGSSRKIQTLTLPYK